MKNFPGILYLIVGNSGSGKDSIISGVFENLNHKNTKIYSPQRYITRPPSETEQNISITENEFEKMLKQGRFAFYWKIYGLNYGIPIEIDDYLKEGYSVLVNVSRSIIEEVKDSYTNVKVVFIKVPLKTTIERIKSRGREVNNALQQRIERAKKHQSLATADYEIENTGKLEEAVNKFKRILLVKLGEGDSKINGER